jgi:hypothetical protein
MFLTYGVNYSRGNLTRASDVARQLEYPPETARRHLYELTKLGLIEREKKTFRPSQNVDRILGLNETTRLLRQASVALGLLYEIEPCDRAHKKLVGLGVPNLSQPGTKGEDDRTSSPPSLDSPYAAVPENGTCGDKAKPSVVEQAHCGLI